MNRPVLAVPDLGVRLDLWQSLSLPAAPAPQILPRALVPNSFDQA
jgi:hypothetical protein